MSHAHHFVIEPPNGPTSSGTCKHCGETRMFANSDESAPMTWSGKTNNQIYVGREREFYGWDERRR